MRHSVLFREVIDVASGQIDPREQPYCDLLHVGGDNIESGCGRLFGLRTARELNLISGKYEFGPNDVLYSKIRPALNKVALPEFAGICSADIYPLRPRTEFLERRYLAYLLRQESFLAYAESHSSRTNIPKINRDALLAYEVQLPLLAEQRRIADILDKADAIRVARKEAITLADDLLRSIFQDMFGYPLTNSKNFDVAPLGSLADIASGVAKGKRYDGQATVNIPYMRVANVQDGHLALAEVKSIDVSGDEAVRYRLQVGDVLLTEGGDPDKLGRGAVWNGEIDPCIHQNHIFRVRTKTGLLPDFLSAQLGSLRGKRYFLRAAKQTTGIASINLGQLKDFPVFVPPLPLQAAYVRVREQISTLKERLRAAATTTEELFGSLVSRAFASRIDV